MEMEVDSNDQSDDDRGTMTLPERRVLNFAGFAACAGMMSFALFAQHVLLLDPCPLCILQRVAVITLGAIFLVAAVHDPDSWGRRVYAVLIFLSAGDGSAVAGWHWRLQNLPPSDVPACGPGLDYMLDNFSLGEALKMVFKGSGECADVVWSFLMPAWVVISLVSLGAAGIWNNLRKQ
jgi:disulfide bond formation protein DsbB